MLKLQWAVEIWFANFKKIRKGTFEGYLFKVGLIQKVVKRISSNISY